jgi:hypothetical protein
VAKTLASTGAILAAAKAVGGIKFEKGGQLPERKKYANGGVINGPSHAKGGVPVLGGRAEVEGGEYIVNTAATAAYLPLLERINSAVPKYANGGVLPSQDRDLRSARNEVIVKEVPVLILTDLQDISDAENRANRIKMGE